jgi:hypothetical protein
LTDAPAAPRRTLFLVAIFALIGLLTAGCSTGASVA